MFLSNIPLQASYSAFIISSLVLYCAIWVSSFFSIIFRRSLRASSFLSIGSSESKSVPTFKRSVQVLDKFIFASLISWTLYCKSIRCSISCINLSWDVANPMADHPYLVIFVYLACFPWEIRAHCFQQSIFPFGLICTIDS